MRQLLSLALSALLCISCSQQYNSAYLISGGMKLAQAAALTDEQIQAYVGQYVQQLDAQSTVLPESDAYVRRVRKMTSAFKSVDGTPLNFKVYKTDEVNAFACADGSVRIYTGLLDAMTDDEVLGVVGHEIGHVALKHSKKQFQEALMSSALRDAVISTGGTVAVLTASQLGDLAETLLSASYSRKQETQADDYGYEFLKTAGKNPWAMAMAFEELQKLSGSSTASGTQGVSGISVSDLFSTHPATADRIQRMASKATKDGFTRPGR